MAPFQIIIFTVLFVSVSTNTNETKSIVNNTVSSTPVPDNQTLMESILPEVIKASEATKLKPATKPQRKISVVGDNFTLNGEVLHIISGSFHYFRTPAEYWQDRLRKIKGAGLNTISTYVEWSFHEPEERQYKFTGDHDIARFIRLAAKEGLHVLLRPGPYICAERDLGGFPYWLLAKKDTSFLRTRDTDFIKETTTWMAKLFEQLKGLLYGSGGPIILVQIENEYGSYGKDHEYMALIRDIIASHVRDEALLYTTDGAYETYFIDGRVNDTITTIDFGAGTDIEQYFARYRKHFPNGPLMNSEYYPGWLTHWGEKFQRVSTERVIKTFKEMLKNGVNVNFYMFYGGTNFEFSAGANFGTGYMPDITSYDYDAPLTEAGDPTEKYYAIRSAIENHFPDVQKIPLPLPAAKANYGIINLTPRIQLLSSKGRSCLGRSHKPFTGMYLPTMEHLRQRAGLILYEIKLTMNSSLIDNQLLNIAIPRDRVYVYLDGELKGIISRMFKIYDLPLTVKSNMTLSLLVEPQGRINFGHKLHDYKGILGNVKLGNETLNGTWSITGFPLEDVNITCQSNLKEYSGPVLYEGFFTLKEGEQPLDTYADLRKWSKGYIWVNGHNLGRYWPDLGPQITLYVPGVWLAPAPRKNRIQILELENAPINATVTFINHPILG